MESKKYSMDLAGRELTLEFGKYCEQAAGSVWVHLGDTVVMVNATMAPTPRPGVDFFPLAVDVEEKQVPVGKIPGGFIKREGRPTEKATLTCRLIDRPLRPLFNKGMRNDVQVVVTVLSVEQDVPPEIPAMIGSSIALAVSEIPWNGPTGAVVVGRVDGQYVINPDEEQRAKSDMHVYLAGTKDAIMMVEAGANEVSETAMLDAIMFGHEYIKKLVEFQDKIVAEIGKEKVEVPLNVTGDDVKQAVREFAYDKCVWVFDTFNRQERQAREAQVKQETIEALAEQFPEREAEIADALYYLNKEVMRKKIIEQGIRPDGRGVTEIRPIWCEVGVLPRVHGSAVFTRGQTQALTVTTLGSTSEGQVLDGLSSEDFKRYIHHYNMPPYATGEAGRLKSPGRREIGHGALAERALLPVIPSEEEFPYAMRLVSEILSSNGSSSMASVCGSTLSLMDAGVPIHAPVAGVAMGLIKDVESGKVAVLTDIQGLEDFLGDMDFKVAGSMNGITAIQMDIKIAGIDRTILETALAQALKDDAKAFYEERETALAEIGLDMREVERVVLLRAVDVRWMDHIDAMDRLRDGIGFRAYSGKNPVTEYQIEAGYMFDELNHLIREDTVRRMYQLRIERTPERVQAAVRPVEGKPIVPGNGQPRQPKRVKPSERVGRNDPCPCGSGLKYKNCCGKDKETRE